MAAILERLSIILSGLAKVQGDSVSRMKKDFPDLKLQHFLHLYISLPHLASCFLDTEYFLGE